MANTNVISILLCFFLLHPVYYKVFEASFPSDSKEARGLFAGVANAMIPRKSFTDLKSALLLTTTRLTCALTTYYQSLCQKHAKGCPRCGQSHSKSSASADGYHGERINSKDDAKATPEFQPSDLIGRTLLMDAKPDGQKFRAPIVEAITQHQQDHANLIKFEILHHIEREENNSTESS